MPIPSLVIARARANDDRCCSVAVERSGQGPLAFVINIEDGDLTALADHKSERVIIRKLRRELGARWQSYLVVMLDCGGALVTPYTGKVAI